MRKNIILGMKIILLMVIMFVGMAVSSLIVGVQHAEQSAGSSVVPLLVYCVLNTLILTAFVLNSQAKGFKLIGITFLIFWGTQYFMTQIETLYFNSAVQMPLDNMLKVVTSGALSALIFSVAAVIILGKFPKDFTAINDEKAVKVPSVNLLRRIAIISFSYVFIYFIFGYYVAWQFPELRSYYTGSTAILNVFQHYAQQMQTDPILPLFQVFRGFLWSGLALLIIRSLRVSKGMAYLITGLLFSILITSPLLFPNPYMPGPVRLGHSLELATSMLTFGILSVFILTKNIV